MPGFPIRTPWDHSLVDSSPRPIAASHVLHRLLVPRHPPFALDNLTTKMLASTVQFSTNDQPTTPTAQHQTRQPPAVCHTRPCLDNQPHPKARNRLRRKQPHGCSFRTQQGALRPPPAAPRKPFPPPKGSCTRKSRPLPGQNSPVSPPSEHPDPTSAGRGLHTVFQRMVLLRKEVIQPHLPVRLPCYDFVPIASPTFDGSLPQGVGPPASGVADFRDVTGGVYKARERIHRSVADLRLLATPTSRGRVADPDPN